MYRGTPVALVLVFVASLAARAEDMKTRESRTVKNDTYGCSAIRPESAEWQIVQGGDLDHIFQQGADVILCFARYSTPTPDKVKDNPMIILYVEPLSVDYFDKYGKKGLAKEIYKVSFEKEYKDVKDLNEAKNVTYKFGKVAEFSFTGVNTKYGNPRTERILCFKNGRQGYLIDATGLPDMVKKYDADVKYFLDNMKFYDVKK